MISRLLNYLAGYLVIKVQGFSLEKFINLTISQGIYLWKIDRSRYTVLTACISIRDFKKLPSILRVVDCRVKILDKKGLPFLTHRLWRRKMLVFGVLFFLMVLYGLSSVIWTVEIEGTKNVNPRRILQKLSEKGIRPGVVKSNINIPDIENKMMIDFPELSWIGIQIKGTKVIVKVVEAVPPPAVVNKDVPCNVIAAKDGVIHKIIVLDGKAVVKEGDTVQKGQLLVSGVIEHPDTSVTRYVHAIAQVMARRWYEGRGKVPLCSFSKQRTGNKVVCKYLKLGEWNFTLKKEDIPFEEYEVVETKRSISYRGFSLPVAFVIKEYYELKEVAEEENDIEALKKQAANLAWEDARKKIPLGAKIIDKKVKYDMIEGEEVSAIMYVEVIENIAAQKEILIDQGGLAD